ncbi:Polyprenyl synthetase [Parasponia andersonii]|uniref:Polyprenyl synthetase n=1 Tax=Parasponia andersonii TaxID=3476 RepID=A0A2P5C9C1_PARAD|nr:Polyprenyl synthetase [Parasponia andersonii]
MANLEAKFMNVYSVLKSESFKTRLLNSQTIPVNRWSEYMTDYNVPRGKHNRGVSFIESYKLLKEGKELSEEEIFLASAIDWCIEYLQGYLLVLDDIEDNGLVRRGHPCWYKLPQFCP